MPACRKRSAADFFLNFVDEYDWPSGEVRNIWMTGNHQSEVLKQNPSFRMKSLAYKEQIVHGPRSVTLAEVPELQACPSRALDGWRKIERETLRRIDARTPPQRQRNGMLPKATGS